jgi:8-hydroxy-5-deazaflavin:NADPH oxidoreductase
MKVGILGSATVAQTLAAGFIKHGYDVALGTREPGKLKDWAAQNPKVKITGVPEAAGLGELLVLAVKGTAALQVLRNAGAERLAGKIVIDACNPIADEPPHKNVLKFFTAQNSSLMEQLQAEFPKAHMVKAFNSVGAGAMVNPHYAGGRPTMFICGDDAAAKRQVAKLLDQFGWDTEDVGAVEAARAIEPLCILWCARGFGGGGWTHAFKLLNA